jgi:ribosomal protein L14E/L6E/L27E
MAKVIIEVKTLQKDTLIGGMVFSKAGRDEDKAYIVVDQLDENYVLLANGDTKTLKMPKKKKLKHLVLTNKVDEQIKNCILSNDSTVDLKVKRYLKLNGTVKEV